jgi:hypothetical protein
MRGSPGAGNSVVLWPKVITSVVRSGIGQCCLYAVNCKTWGITKGANMHMGGVTCGHISMESEIRIHTSIHVDTG